MPLTHEQAQMAHKMASEDYTITAILRHLGLQGDGWHAVRAEAESWQGLELGISLQLEKLANGPSLTKGKNQDRARLPHRPPLRASVRCGRESALRK